MPDRHRPAPPIFDEGDAPAVSGHGFFFRPPVAASLIAGLGLSLTVALVSAEGFWPSRDEVRLQQTLRGELPGSDQVPDGAYLEFERMGCFGTCPMYTVRVEADGEVHFSGERFVCRQGAVSQRIDPVAARRLLAGLGAIDWRAVNASMAIPMMDAEVVRVRLVLGTQVSEADFQPAIHGYASAVPPLIEQVARLGRWLPTWSWTLPEGPQCAGEDGAPPQAPAWWRDGRIVWDEAQ